MTTRPRVLVIAKDYFRLGGVALHTQSLAEAMAERFDITIAVPQRATRQIALLKAGEGNAVYGLFAADAYAGPFHDRAVVTERSLAQIIQHVQPQLVHVQHFASWPLAMLRMLADSKTKFIVTFHDHFAITPDAGMSDVQDPMDCFTPAYGLRAFGKDISAKLAARRDFLATMFTAASARVTASRYLTHVIGRVFAMPCREIEYGVHGFSPLPKAPPAGGLRFGFAGPLRGNKGWRVLHEGFLRVQGQHPTIECRFYGGGEDPPAASRGVTFFGAYQRDDLPRICSEIDVAIIPSLFRETYCMALSEMWMGEVPVAVSDLGALADRVIDGVNGRKFPPNDPAALARTMQWFIEHPDMWRAWRLPRPRTTAQMADDFRALYDELLC